MISSSRALYCSWCFRVTAKASSLLNRSPYTQHYSRILEVDRRTPIFISWYVLCGLVRFGFVGSGCLWCIPRHIIPILAQTLVDVLEIIESTGCLWSLPHKYWGSHPVSHCGLPSNPPPLMPGVVLQSSSLLMTILHHWILHQMKVSP